MVKTLNGFQAPFTRSKANLTPIPINITPEIQCKILDAMDDLLNFSDSLAESTAIIIHQIVPVNKNVPPRIINDSDLYPVLGSTN